MKKRNLRRKRPKKNKRPYSSPQLTILGSVEKLTKNIGTVGADGLTGSRLL